MLKVKTMFVTIMLSFLAAASFPASALAADFNITTSPLPVLLTAKPGTTVSTKLRVQNSGTEATTFKVGLKKFKANGDSGQPVILDKAAADDYFNWVSFSKNSFEADPGVWNEITMTIKVPSSAAFGYYYAVTFSEDQSANPKPVGNSAHINGAAAILVLLDVQAKGERKQLNVVSFSADKKLYEYLPATFSVKVHNSGNIHLAPAGSIFITRGKSNVATLDINPASGNVLPNSDRTFTPAWSDGFPVFATKRDNGQIVTGKDGRPEKQLQWDFSKVNHLRFGHYTAHMLLTYDNGSRDVPLEGTVSFWVVPWKILPLIVIAILLILVGLWTSGKNLYRKIRK
jgi:hypothetical protein